jgi:hypothetical protein
MEINVLKARDGSQPRFMVPMNLAHYYIDLKNPRDLNKKKGGASVGNDSPEDYEDQL